MLDQSKAVHIGFSIVGKDYSRDPNTKGVLTSGRNGPNSYKFTNEGGGRRKEVNFRRCKVTIMTTCFKKSRLALPQTIKKLYLLHLFAAFAKYND